MSSQTSKEPKSIKDVPWQVGVRDRGMGNVDFGVITKEKKMRDVVECWHHGPNGHDMASYIAELHNAELKKKGKVKCRKKTRIS